MAATMHLRFVCAAGERVGLGHVSRASALAQVARRQGHRCTLDVRGRGDTGRLERFFDTSATGPDPPRGSGPVEVVVYDPAPMAGCARSANSVVIDDGPPRQVDADVVVNPNLSAVAAGYRGGGAVFAGPMYAIVDPVFVAARPGRPRDRRTVTRVLVSCGSADPAGMTERYVRALGKLAMSLEIRVAIGALNPRQESIVRECRAAGARPVVDADNLAALGRWCDVALTTLGTTASEFACMGVPNLAVAVSDLQVPFLYGYGELGVVWPIGQEQSMTDARILDRIAEALGDPTMLAGLSRAGMDTVDGRGAERVVDAIAAVIGRAA